MNIMLFSRICARTGVGNHIKELAEELMREGHKVVVVSGTNDINIPENAGGGVFNLLKFHYLELIQSHL